jgi:hypothetical protein
MTNESPDAFYPTPNTDTTLSKPLLFQKKQSRNNGNIRIIALKTED